MRNRLIDLLATLTLCVAALAPPAAAQVADHLECFKIKDPELKLKGFVDLETPQFGLDPGCKIAKAEFLCAPATKTVVEAKNGKTPITPIDLSAPPAAGDRICYTVKCPKEEVPDQFVTDQFGQRTVEKLKAKLVCTPAVKGSSFCGDGTIDGSEQCEPGDLGGATCESQGFASGTLACAPGCSFDTSGCTCGSCPPGQASPASGQTTAFTADKNDGIDGAVAVPDDGTVQAGGTLAYMDNGDGTVTDLNTGLMWEKKSDDGGLHDKDTLFRWSGDGTQETIWDWLDDVNAEDGTGFAGHSDWRVPNVKELQSIVDYGDFSPPVDDAFNNGCASGCTVLTCSCTVTSSKYWSSTTVLSAPTLAWFVSFDLGFVDVGGKSVSGRVVRAVRGGS